MYSYDVNLDLALGTAGARVVELIRRQNDSSLDPALYCPDETMFDELIKVAGTRLDPERYHNDRPVDSAVVFDVAIKAGFVKPEIYQPTNYFEAILGIHSDPEPFEEEVEAVLVFGAAGLSNHKRIYHALKAVRASAAKTSRIIIAAGQRLTSETERVKLAAVGLSAGTSEYELCQNAVRELFGVAPQEVAPIPMSYGERRFFAHSSRVVDTHGIEIELIEAPFDPKRRLPNGQLATRANTEETLIPVRSTLSTDRPLYVVSHDIWQPVQEVIARRMLPGHSIVGSGPQNLDRVSRNEATGQLKLNAASSVQDEMKKLLYELARLHPLTRHLFLS